MQAPRIAGARAMSVATIQAVIDDNTGAPFLGFIGQPHVNVLAVNRSLDAKYPAAHPKG